jgi:hypothetical protein
MKRLWASGLLLAAYLLVLGTAASTAGRTPLRTLVASKQPIYAVAQSSAALAWVTGDGRIRMERFGHGRSSVIGTVEPPERATSATIAVAGTRALWAYDSGGNNYEMAVTAGGLGTKAAGVALLDGGPRGYGDGRRFAGFAGDASTLAYGSVDETCDGAPYGVCDFCRPDYGSCPLVVTGGGVSIVTAGTKPSAVPQVRPPALFALSADLVSIAPARSPLANVEPVPRVVQDGPVEVYDRSGALIARIPLQGLVRGLALSNHRLAVLLEQPAGNRVVLQLGARTGLAQSGTAFVSMAATDLATSTGGTVFRVGRDIYSVRGRTATRIARAASTPVGLSIVGNRVVWAENIHGHGRVQAVNIL